MPRSMQTLYSHRFNLMVSAIKKIKRFKMAALVSDTSKEVSSRVSDMHSGMHNRYFAVRHGQSESNVQKILVSNPTIGSQSYGLTDLGKQQAQKAGEKLKTMLSGSDAIMVSSIFKRARETAEIIHSILGCTQPLQINEALNERGFGSCDLKNSSIVYETWKSDANDAVTTQHGIESVMSVLSRTSRLVKQLEDTYTDKDIILVSHGDPLRILLASFVNIDPSQHASIRHFDNAEIRILTDPNVLGN